MAHNAKVVSDLSIKIGEKAADTELSPDLTAKVLEVVVDQQVHLPSMFTLRLHDADLKLLDDGPFKLTSQIEIAGKDAQQNKIVLIKGEITALEPTFGEGMTGELLVRGYDQLHRLYRAVKSKTYLNVKDSDLATQFAQTIGLQAEVESTVTVYDHLYQHNQSDLNFLLQRAWRIGYECFIDSETLVFRKPLKTEPKVTLTWGDALLSFHPRMTLAEQVEKVEVKGWDVQKKAAILGQAQKGDLYPQRKAEKDGGQWAEELAAGSKMVIVDQPVVSQAEADILAQARLNEISGIFIEAEGTAFRRPEIKAGQRLKLTGLGQCFSGNYLVTSATHIYTHAGFKTTFSVRGMHTGLLTEALLPGPPLDRWPGVVPAIVTNTDDPNQWGRVKVKYPWLSDQEESDWVRVASPGAGPQTGFCAVPAVEDEVLVAFVHGNFDQPIVLGGLWNGQAALPPPVADAPEGEKAQVRSWRSRSGHRITMADNSEKKLEIVTAGGLKIVLDDGGKQITIVSNGGIEIKADGNLTIKAGGNLELQATGQVNVKGTPINLN